MELRSVEGMSSAEAEQICAESWLGVFVEHADVFTLRLKVLTSLEGGRRGGGGVRGWATDSQK